MPSGRLIIDAVPGIGAIRPGDDLISILGDAMDAMEDSLADGDVVVIAQKVVSKAEDRFFHLENVTPSARAEELSLACDKDPRLVELILSEASSVVRCQPGVLIVNHRLGHTMANAGIDTSNVGVSPNHDAQHVLLWPEDPDASAKALSRCMFEAFGVSVPVIINDSLGRPWRMGTVGFAIGVAGLQAVWDQVGERDLDGRVMQVTAPAVADSLAAAASLVQGETDQGMPVVWAQGVALRRAADGSSRDLLRQPEQDMFR